MLDDLIEWLEKATEPDLDLDREIMWEVRQVRPEHRSFNDRPPLYTASIDAALTLIPEGFAADITAYDGGRGDARLWADQKQPISTRVGPNRPASPPIALCIVALKARKALT